MSNLTSFRIRVPENLMNAFIAAIASNLEPGSCEGPQFAVQSSALNQTFSSLASGELREACLSFAFEEDEMLETYRNDDADARSRLAGKVAVGCFWTTCEMVDGHFDIDFTSASSSISRLMKESASVQSTFLKLGKYSQSGSVLVIDEWNDESFLGPA